MPDAEEDELALAIGWVVIEAGKAEGTAGELLMLHKAPETSAKASKWYETGNPLTEALKRLAARNGLVSLDHLAHQLEQATQRRNDLVHGEWIPAIGLGLGIMTFRRERPNAAPDGGYAARTWSLSDLHVLADEYRAIENGLARLVSEYMGIEQD